MEIREWPCEIGEHASDPFLPLLRQAMTKGQEIQQDVKMGERSYSIAVVPIPGEGYANIYGRDVTDRKQAEEALRKSEERFRSVVENMSEGLMLFDAQGMIYQNPASLRLHGFKGPEEMQIEHKELPTTWKGWDETGRPLSFEEWPVSRVLRHERFQDQVLRAVRVETGHEFYGSYNGSPILAADGKLTLGLISIRDITERKRAEEAQQTTLQHLHALVASMHSSILLVGEGRIEMANQAFCDYFELQESPADLVGLTPQRLIDKIKNAYLHPEEEVARIREIVGRDQPIIGEEVSMRGNRTCLRDFIPIHVDGKSYGRLWQHTDITERKRAEEALKEGERREREKALELDTILATVPIPVFIAHDPDCIHITGNPAARRHYRPPRKAGPAISRPSRMVVNLRSMNCPPSRPPAASMCGISSSVSPLTTELLATWSAPACLSWTNKDVRAAPFSRLPTSPNASGRRRRSNCSPSSVSLPWMLRVWAGGTMTRLHGYRSGTTATGRSSALQVTRAPMMRY
jgi:PAS domain S-box-containing protein